MNLGQNKFFVGFGAVIAIGCLGLGWLTYSSYCAYDEATADFDTKAARLNELQNLPLYPEKGNVKLLEEQKKTAEESIVALHQTLANIAFPLEPLTPEQFQDRLNASVKTLSEKAAKAGVVFSDKQNLGFLQYRSAVPKPEAAAALGRQLRCIETAVAAMIDQKVASIDSIERPLLPEEADEPNLPPAEAAKPGRKKGNSKPEPKGEPLVSKYPFSIKFTGEQQAFQGVINELSKSRAQFYIIRNVKIDNQMTKSPKRVASRAASKNATPEATAPANKLQYIFGGEKLTATLDFDSVVFISNLPK